MRESTYTISIVLRVQALYLKPQDFIIVLFWRLGLGAKFVPHSKFAATLNPVEKKLRAKLNAAKQQFDLGTEEACSSDKDIKEYKCKDNNVDDIDSDDSDSRANAFSRK